MPPPKKAAKKAAKKGPGHHRHDKHHHEKHHPNDLRRAYEHMGRVAVLQKTLKPPAAEAVTELTALAQREITDGHSKDAADLLRASEHLSFAVLAGKTSADDRISDELEEAITEHFEELTRRADEHWGEVEEHSGTLAEIYQSSIDSAEKALQNRAYHQALEFARAAEALAHVKQHGPPKLKARSRETLLLDPDASSS